MGKTVRKLAVSCGGTGGHFNPGLGVAREFALLGGEPLILLGGKNAPKQAEIVKKNAMKCRIIRAEPKSLSPVKLLKFLFATVRGYLQCRKIYREEKPQALLAMGSFASLPPVLAARSMGIPIFLHDGNARIGRANLFLSRWAKALALSFPSVNSGEAACPTVLTGMPVRKELVNAMMTKEEAVAEINRRWNVSFDPAKPILLFFGGSLGARTINTKLTVDPALPFAGEIQQIRLAGSGKAEAEEASGDAAGPTLILESCQEMNLLYSAADLTVSRSGGSTVSELAIYGKFAFLVPYPFAADRHQDDNARWLASENGAVVMDDERCSRESFSEFLTDWFHHREEYTRKGEASKRLAKPEAAKNVADLIENIVSLRKKS